MSWIQRVQEAYTVLRDIKTVYQVASEHEKNVPPEAVLLTVGYRMTKDSLHPSMRKIVSSALIYAFTDLREFYQERSSDLHESINRMGDL